jgi:hypothetical protein
VGLKHQHQGSVRVNVDDPYILKNTHVCSIVVYIPSPLGLQHTSGEAPSWCDNTKGVGQYYVCEVTFPRPVKSVCYFPGCLPSRAKTGLPAVIAHPHDMKQNHLKTKLLPTAMLMPTAMLVE